GDVRAVLDRLLHHVGIRAHEAEHVARIGLLHALLGDVEHGRRTRRCEAGNKAFSSAPAVTAPGVGWSPTRPPTDRRSAATPSPRIDRGRAAPASSSGTGTCRS